MSASNCQDEHPACTKVLTMKHATAESWNPVHHPGGVFIEVVVAGVVEAVRVVQCGVVVLTTHKHPVSLRNGTC